MASQKTRALAATFVIATRNRVEELRALLRSVLAQTVPVEILVMDDGGSEAVAEMIRIEFPQVRYHSLGIGRGPAFQRNRGIELAACEVVFPLDDDTILVSPRTVEQTLAEFERPCVGAVGIPFINVRIHEQIQQRSPSAQDIWVAHAFIGAAHAVRRSAFMRAGGYREHFFYMGEEGDLCLRLLNLGYVVRLGRADPIHHLESPNRNLATADYSGRRNDVLFAWHNVPLLFLPFHLAATTFNGLPSVVKSHQRAPMLLGMLHGYTAILRHRGERYPVSIAVYLLHRKLKKRGPCALAEVTRQLPFLVQENGVAAVCLNPKKSCACSR